MFLTSKLHLCIAVCGEKSALRLVLGYSLSGQGEESLWRSDQYTSTVTLAPTPLPRERVPPARQLTSTFHYILVLNLLASF